MMKFIYPISSTVWKKRTAWDRVRKLEFDYDLCLIRPKVRQETFESDSIFRGVGGTPYVDTRRVFTFTFFLTEDQAAEFLSRLCTSRQKLARILHKNTVLLLVDEDLTALAA